MKRYGDNGSLYLVPLFSSVDEPFIPNITLHYVTLRYITLHYITLHYITLHYITLHYITLHYITLHYITLHYTLMFIQGDHLAYEMVLLGPLFYNKIQLIILTKSLQHLRIKGDK